MPNSAEPSPSAFRLCTVQVGAIRSLLEVGPLPVQGGMTVIAGRNDGGKTSLFDALNMLLNNIPIPAEARTTGATAEQPTHVVGEFRGDCKEATIRLRARIDDPRAVTREIEDRVHAGLGGALEDLSLQKLRERMAALGIKNPGGSAKPPYVESPRQWLETRPDCEFQLRWRALSKAEGILLPRFSVFRSQEAADPVSQIQRLVAREARRIMADSYSPTLKPLSRKLNADIAPSLERIKASILQYCPTIDSVDATAEFDFTRTTPVVTFVVRKGNEDILFEQLADGQRQRIILALHRSELQALQEEVRGHPQIIAYDEPDTHLDYSSQRDLFDILSAQATIPHVQVLVATHSSNFIDKVPLTSLVHFRLDDINRTVAEVITAPTDGNELAFLESMAAGIGPRNSAIVGEKAFFLVEGATEEGFFKIIFRRTFKSSLVGAGIGVIEAEGKQGVRKLIETLTVQWRRATVAFVDQDARAAPDRVITEEWMKKLGLIEGESLFFVGEKEFEDAFSDRAWASVANESFPRRDGGDGWAEADFAELREGLDVSFSDALLALFRERCRRYVGKPELGEALAQQVSKEEIPAAVKDCLAALRVIANGVLPNSTDTLRMEAE